MLYVTGKKIDVYGQAIIFVLSIAIVLILGLKWMLAGYFIMGGWQLCSSLVHYAYGSSWLLSRLRKHYHTALLMLLVAGILCFALPFITFFYLYALLLVSPVMALFYLRISWLELKIWQARSFVHLK